MDRSRVSLENFFIFNPTYSSREGEEEKKILFYHPKEASLDTKVRTIGLCEAVTQFVVTFSDKPCQSLHTKKFRQFFFQPEKDFWMVYTLRVPRGQKVMDDKAYDEYKGEDVLEAVYEAVLQHSYKMFRLFMGTFSNILIRSGGAVHKLIQRLDHFFGSYILSLKLDSCDILDVYSGISFMSLDKNMYTKIQCLINKLEMKLPEIKYTVFLCKEYLVWSGLEQDDMQIMYRYLTGSLLPTYSERELSQISRRPPGAINHFGKFVAGPPNVKDPKTVGKIPRVFVNGSGGKGGEECYLIVYKALTATVCMLVDATSQPKFEFFESIDSHLGQPLTVLANELAELYLKKPSPSLDSPFKYIYFNRMNLAQKTTIHVDTLRSRQITVPTDVLRIIGDLHGEMRSHPGDSDAILKTVNDDWVVMKKSDNREFFVVLNIKNASMIEVNEEVKRLCAGHFSNIFFLD